MLRFWYVIVISLPYIIYYLAKGSYIEKNTEKYSEEDRYRVALRVIHVMKRNGRIRTSVTGVENLPAEGGYDTWLHGKVVDMFYFPLIQTHFPDWFPLWGGEEFIFFRPIFNLADSAICVGVFLLLLFYRQTLSDSLSTEKDAK